jgi:hypothetical protein
MRQHVHLVGQQLDRAVVAVARVQVVHAVEAAQEGALAAAADGPISAVTLFS